MTQIYKLISVTRNDLTPGYQSVMAAHALIQFQHDYPEISKDWSKYPYLALLSVKNEEELSNLISKLEKSKIKFSVFRESDIDNQITSICIEPSDASRRATSSLPKMLRDLSAENQIDKNNYVKEEIMNWGEPMKGKELQILRKTASRLISKTPTNLNKKEDKMKDKTIEELKKEFEDRRWGLLDWLNSAREYDEEVQKVSDEMELILKELKEREIK